jgi:hypothetical protein
MLRNGRLFLGETFFIEKQSLTLNPIKDPSEFVGLS